MIFCRTQVVSKGSADTVPSQLPFSASKLASYISLFSKGQMLSLLIGWATTTRLSCFSGRALRADPLLVGLSSPLPRALSGTPRAYLPPRSLDGKLPNVWAASHRNSTSGTAREARFCLWTSAPALESKGVSCPFC